VPELTLASFNTHCGMWPHTGAHRGLQFDLGGALATLGDPDVIVLQEVYRLGGQTSPVDAFATARDYEVHDLPLGRFSVRPERPVPDPTGPGTLSVTVLSRLAARELARPAVGPTLADPVRSRRVLHLELAVEGQPVDLVAVHLTARLPHGPPQQLWRLARALPAGDRPTVVAGDCNFWGPPTVTLLGGWRRAVRGRTWPADRPHSQIDHVLVRGRISVAEGDVLPAVGSDHRPVRARLTLPRI